MNTATPIIFIKIIAIFLISFIFSKTSILLLIRLLKAAGCTRINYRSKEVIFGAGIAFVPIIMAMSALSLLIFPKQYIVYSSYVLAVCAMGFAGILDDMIGEKSIKGLKNHISSFVHGHLTTGFIKAFVGIFIALIISINISLSIVDFFLNVFNITLFTNTLNLMDLRPGRCAKTFLFIGFLIFFLNLTSIITILPLGIALTMTMVYLIYDLNELCILGDTGSNILGITLGYFSAYCNNTPVKLMFFIALLALNIAAERISFTTIISRNKLLNFLDSLGRSDR